MQAGDPGTILVTCWLPARYYIARYHIGRPRVYVLALWIFSSSAIADVQQP
jgi:hypothetical protein